MNRRNGITLMLRLVSILGRFAYFLIFAVINGSLGYLLSMAVTILAGVTLAKILGLAVNISYLALIIMIIVCGLLRGVLRYIEQYSNHYIAFKLLKILRDKVFKALRGMSYEELDEKRNGDLMSMVTADIETLEVFYAHTLSPILIAIVVSSTILLFLGFTSSWYLALLALAFYLLLGVVLPIISSKLLKRYGVSYRNNLASFTSFYLDSIKGIREIVLHNNQNKRKEAINLKTKSLYLAAKPIKRVSSQVYAITDLMISSAIIISIVISIILLNNNLLTLGGMIIGLVTIFSSFGPVVQLTYLPSDLTQTFASAERVINLLDKGNTYHSIVNKNDIDADTLELSNVSFAYNDVEVIKNINLSVKNGEIVGLVGKSGSGKSTILKLILGRYKNNTGSIKLNGIDINEINTKSLLDNVSMVSQMTYLFNTSILNNIMIAKPNATKEEVIDACKKASIHDFIMSLDNGYDTVVGNSLDNISAGEKQRLGLARVFLRGSKIILLDEVTSNIDSINEGIILNAIKKEAKDKCFILVTHRKSTASICDRIYTLKDSII